MPTEPIPFGPNQASGWEPLAGGSPLALNVVVDGRGAVHRRPGIQNVATAPSTSIDGNGVSGLYVTSAGKLFAVGGSAPSRSIYAITGGAAVDLTGVDQGDLRGTLRPTFAETEALLVIAGGADMQKMVLDGSISSRLAGSPPQASHVSFLASRLLANDVQVDKSKINFSSPASSTVTTGHEQWNGTGSSGFTSAEARPDPIVALGDNGSELFAWGQTNLEIFTPDAFFAFARVVTRDFGCIAPYSVTRQDTNFAWLDHRRRLILGNGRAMQPISGPIEADLQAMGTVSDCIGARVKVGVSDCLVWVFPTEGRTMAVQTNGGGWSQWQSTTSGVLGPFNATAFAHDPVTDTQYVATSDGIVGQLSHDAADDLGEDIVARVETGFIDHGTDENKECQRVQFALERGTTSSTTTEPVAFVQWADEPGVWCSPRPLWLGMAGQARPVITLSSLGVYRRRNWRFTFSSSERLALASARETYTVTGE